MKRFPGWAWAVVVLLIVLLFNAVFTPGFFEVQLRDGRAYGSMIDVLKNATPAGLLALGMTLVIATGGVDLSVGAIMAIAGATAAGLIARPSGTPFASGRSSPGLAIPAALAVSLLCGLFNGLLVALLDFQPIVATLLLMVAGRGVAQLLSNGQIVSFRDPILEGFGRGATLGLPNSVWLLLSMFALFGLLTRATALGLFVEATGSNSVAAQYVGIDARGIKLTAYALSGLCAGLAGIVSTSDLLLSDASNSGIYLELDAILAVSVGGTALAGGRFSLAGSVIGALLMQTLTTTILTRGISPETTLVIKAIVVIAVCLLQAPTFRESFSNRFRRAEA